MRIGFALWTGVFCEVVASWVGLAVEGGSHQVTLWNWIVLGCAFLTGFVASLIVTSEAT